MRTPISRRALLRGAGVSLALPWLEAMAATTPKSPVRMAVLYMPNGVNTTAWIPEGSGRNFTLSPTLEPLQDLKDDVVVVSNLWNAEYQRRRWPLRQGSRDPHLPDDQEDSRRRSQQRHFDGSGGGAARRRSDPAPVARTGNLARRHRYRRRRRIHAHLRLAHRLEQSVDSAGARDQPALGIRAPVPRLLRSARQLGQDGHASPRSRSRRRQAPSRASRLGRSPAPRRVSGRHAFSRRARAAFDRRQPNGLESPRADRSESRAHRPSE